MIRKDGGFCDQNLESVAILDKKLKVFHPHFFNFNSSFFQNIFHLRTEQHIDFCTQCVIMTLASGRLLLMTF